MSVIDSGTLRSVARHGAIALSLLALAACGDTAPDPGTIVVSFSTNPGDEVPFVWGVSVDGGSPHNVTSGDTGTFTIEGVSAGDHHLVASSFPKACTTGSDDRPITVPAHDTVRATFSLKCAKTSGDIAVLVSTTGLNPDPSGYLITVGTGKPSLVAPSSATDFSVLPGTYTVTITDLEANCTTASASKSASPAQAQTVTVTFDVVCGAYPATTAGATVTDPVGDTLSQSTTTYATYYDILGANTRYGAGFMVVTVKLNRPVTNAVGGVIDMDLDEKLSTGDSSVASFFGAPPQGTDAFVQFRSDKPGSFLEVFPYQSASGIQVVTAGDTVQVYVPLDHIKDDGNMTLSIAIGRILANTQGDFIIFTDFAPNSTLMVTRAPTGTALGDRFSPERTTTRLTRTVRETGRVYSWGRAPR